MQNTKLDIYYKILSKRLGVYYKSGNEITLRDGQGEERALGVRGRHRKMNSTGLDLPLPLW